MIEWFPSEWADHGLSGWLDGISADVVLNTYGEGWRWSVQPTSSRCEFPELFDCNTSATLEDAKIAAENAMRRANSLYERVSYV